MVSNKNTAKVSPAGRIIAITSGKGGVGKTSVTVNLGLSLVQQGLRVCVVDADTNLANINIMLKQMPEFTLEHVINGDKNIKDIIMQTNGLCIVPAATGASSLINQSAKQSKRLVDAVASLQSDFDYVLVDTSAGISDSVLRYIQGSHQSIFVITSEPTSLTDSYSLLKVLYHNKIHKKTAVVINFSQNSHHALSVFSRFSKAVEKYMGYKIGYLGFIFRDDYLSSSVCFQSPLLLQRPESKTSQCFHLIAKTLHAGQNDGQEHAETSLQTDTLAASESFSSEDIIEKTVSLANLENDFERYLHSNSESKIEIEQTLNKLTRQYQQMFGTQHETALPMEMTIVSTTQDSENIQSHVIQSTEPESACIDPVTDNVIAHSDYQGFLDSIQFASMLDDYSRITASASILSS